MRGKYTPERRALAFWSKVDKNGPVPEHRPDLGPCWLWTASLNNMGYGKFWDGSAGRLLLAHRWTFVATKGPIPGGLQLDHLCRVPACVNPDHLEPVTIQENTLRGIAPAAVHATKTECPHGHPYSGENLIRRKNGQRACRTCNQTRDRARWPRRSHR